MASKSPWKTCKELQSDLATSGVLVDPSIFLRRLLASGRIARKPTKKQLLTTKMKNKNFSGQRNIEAGVQISGKK